MTFMIEIAQGHVVKDDTFESEADARAFCLKYGFKVVGEHPYFFGMEAYYAWGGMIIEKLAGRVISKRQIDGDLPGGLAYEAKNLGIGTFDLLECLEGLCNKGYATEIDDSHYKVKEAA